MLPTGNKLHTTFAYRTLPDLVFDDPQGTFERLSDGQGIQFIVQTWRDLGNRLNDVSSPAGIQCHELAQPAEKQDDHSVFVITLPSPTQSGEALYIGLDFLHVQFLFKRMTTAARYFLLELEKDEETGSEDWVFNEMDKEGNLFEYGVVENSDYTTFVQTLRDALAGLIEAEPVEQEVEEEDEITDEEDSLEGAADAWSTGLEPGGVTPDEEEEAEFEDEEETPVIPPEDLDQAIRKMIAELRDPDGAGGANFAGWALVGLGKAAVPYLEDLKSDPDPNMQHIATQLLLMIERGKN